MENSFPSNLLSNNQYQRGYTFCIKLASWIKVLAKLITVFFQHGAK